MTVLDAITTIQKVGSVNVEADRIRCKVPPDRAGDVEEALAVLRNNKPEALAMIEATAPVEKDQPLEAVIKGRAIELWSDAAGRLFLVADDDDARLAMDRYGLRRGEVYTATEARRIVAIGDPALVLEIHRWKREFDARIRA